jgi:hypothetical protein
MSGASGRWGGSGRKEIRRGAGREEADPGWRGDKAIGLIGCERNGERLGRRYHPSMVADPDAVAGGRVARIGGFRVVLLMLGNGAGRISGTGVQPLHCAPGNSGSEENKGEGQSAALSQERQHAQKIGCGGPERKDPASAYKVHHRGTEDAERSLKHRVHDIAVATTQSKTLASDPAIS